MCIIKSQNNVAQRLDIICVVLLSIYNQIKKLKYLFVSLGKSGYHKDNTG